MKSSAEITICVRKITQRPQTKSSPSNTTMQHVRDPEHTKAPHPVQPHKLPYNKRKDTPLPADHCANTNTIRIHTLRLQEQRNRNAKNVQQLFPNISRCSMQTYARPQNNCNHEWQNGNWENCLQTTKWPASHPPSSELAPQQIGSPRSKL